MNKDIKARDEKIFGEFDRSKYMGGCRRFKGVDLETLDWLLENDFIDPKETQNYSPTVADFREFLKENPTYTVHGYCVIDTRDDYRMNIEGVERDYPAETITELERFIDFNKDADELDYKDYMYSWWD